tara:strand:+ start:414 stop:1328 length:915 start_codon:yes stop_codon:yes gene_type:complete
MSAGCISASECSAPTRPTALTPDIPPSLSTICGEELARQLVAHDPDHVIELLLSEKAGRAALNRQGRFLIEFAVGSVMDLQHRSTGHPVNLHVRALSALIKCDTNTVGIALKGHSNAVTDNPVYDWYATCDFPVDEQIGRFGLFQGGAVNALFELLNEGRHAELLLEEWRRYVFSPSYPNSPFQVDWRAFTGGEQTGRLSFDTTHGCLVADIEAVVDMVGGPGVLREKAAKMYAEQYGEEEHSPHTPYDLGGEDVYTAFSDPNQEMLDIITEEVHCVTRGDWNTRETRGQLVGATRPWLVIEFV